MVTSQISEHLLIIFTKNPKLGKVKSRLAKDLGNQKALKIYQYLLNNIQNKFIKSKFDVMIYYSGGSDNIPKKYKLNPQKGKDLGQKMYNAFKKNSKKYKKIIIIGTDCPFIGKRIVNKAFRALNRNQVVLGPSEDGGYYLIGLSRGNLRQYRRGFQKISWSTSKVLPQTLKQFKFLGIKPFLLEKLYDIDTIKEYKRWKRKR
ncbi:MAG: glycosyltransferase [Candidatus Saganbacteria bacterium]|nr:glycosyltransferase [Candidatus Saganbacteria bacterium]